MKKRLSFCLRQSRCEGVRTRQDVARAVPLIGAGGEEPGVVALLNHHKGDGGPVLCIGVPHAQACSSQLHTTRLVSTAPKTA